MNAYTVVLRFVVENGLVCRETHFVYVFTFQLFNVIDLARRMILMGFICLTILLHTSA